VERPKPMSSWSMNLTWPVTMVDGDDPSHLRGRAGVLAPAGWRPAKHGKHAIDPMVVAADGGDRGRQYADRNGAVLLGPTQA
jgi:hypothetical protein